MPTDPRARRDAQIIREYQRLKAEMFGRAVRPYGSYPMTGDQGMKFWNRLGQRLGLDHEQAYLEATRVCKERADGTSPSLEITDRKQRKRARQAANRPQKGVQRRKRGVR